MLEVNLGIWAACAPMMKPFVRFVRYRYFGKESKRSHSLSALSFWHRSWWKPSSGLTNGNAENEARRNIDIINSKPAKRVREEEKDIFRPLSFGTRLQDRMMEGSRLNSQLFNFWDNESSSAHDSERTEPASDKTMSAWYSAGKADSTDSPHSSDFDDFNTTPKPAWPLKGDLG